MKAIICLSGGIDSTVMLAQAKAAKIECLALSFDYNQRHKIELEAAKKIALHYKVPHLIVKIDPITFAKSSLVEKSAVPKDPYQGGIPSTYVPARNTLFLAYALGQAEIHGADQILFGANKEDQAGYPDCRPEFFQAFESVALTATKDAVEGKGAKILTPLIEMTKEEIIHLGKRLNAPLDLTWSCYDPQAGMKECTLCHACRQRNILSSPPSPF
jgi:7-cyano-7-deazaguanine synthase